MESCENGGDAERIVKISVATPNGTGADEGGNHEEVAPGMQLTGELNAGDNVVSELVIDGVNPEDNRSQLYVDDEHLESKGDGQLEILRLDPGDVKKIGELSGHEYFDAPAQRLHIASTMPSESINLFLDDAAAHKAEEPEAPQIGPGLSRTSSAPCMENKKDGHRQKKSKISHRKKKRLMRRLGSITGEGVVEIDEQRFQNLPDIYDEHAEQQEQQEVFEEGDERKILPLQIAMLIVGTRGDVQPFVAIGKELQKHGHRVRLASHVNFREFVRTAGLEFYPLGGDPKVLAGYMVKNKGFLPSGPKEIKTQRKQLKEIVNSLYPACVEPDEETLIPFKAQAIIANPPAYGHVHVAEALNVPIHIFFTMPWTPTSEFPHPLSRITNLAANRLSYQVVDTMIWLGIRSLINDFRKKKLKLRPVSYLGTSRSQGSISDLPTCYIWSPSLVPKPKDWGPRIDVVGYCFLSLASEYKPPDDLVEWLQAGSKPVYVGFGSLPVKDPSGMTQMIISALRQTNQRGLIDKGWGGIGDSVKAPEFVYFIENCPHDWLFPQCAAVVHHGGAGTTAAGLKAACPTTVVPFFGDQPFWGARVHDRGIGPSPIPVDSLTLEKLVDAINFMLSPEVKQRAEEVARCIAEEDGVRDSVKAFHKQLPKEMPLPTPPPSPHSHGFAFLNPFCCSVHNHKQTSD